MNGNSLKDNGAKLMNLAHRLVLKASGNRLLAQPFGMPLVELHTTGAQVGVASVLLPDHTCLRLQADGAHRIEGWG
jgi:hypothetical protein